MELIDDISRISFLKETVLTVGTFDGIHRGHQALLQRLVRAARKNSCRSVLVTFTPHPQTVVKRKHSKPIKILTTLEEKQSKVAPFGVDIMLVVKFTPEFAGLSPEVFVKEYLIEKIGLSHMLVGYDHAFGKSRKGGIELLANMAKVHDFAVMHEEPVYHDKMIVSSTAIREVLFNGSVRIANRMLGYNYILSGAVVQGEGRGKELTFPTANISVDNEYKLIPSDGVYAGYLFRNNERFRALISIGHKPTFSGTKQHVETYIFNFDENIYGETVHIEFVKYLRGQIKFENAEQLISEMNKDKKEAKKYFNFLEENQCR